MQICLAIIGRQDILKVIDQGADDSINAVNIKRFVRQVTGIRETDLSIVDGKINSIGRLSAKEQDLPRVDATGRWVLPGFIDLHSDAIEKVLKPRPRADLPMEIALTELDKNLAACGITTMYHCISFTGKQDNRPKIRDWVCASYCIGQIR